ncbi:hypothetical protein R4Y45_04035 [Holzapfeliella sp. He02]|uniref:Uncharacterized protein n=1 Tax=Holzapfeliella saturejae TaxID=3082953 RepID=A0ABU8SG86_9LACO
MALPSNYYRKKLRGLRRIWKKELRYLNELADESDNDIEIPAPLIIPFTGKTRKFKQKYRNE